MTDTTDNAQAMEMMRKLKLFVRNPSLTFDYFLDLLLKATHGRVKILDPSGPFPFAMEACVCTAATLINSMDESMHKLYPKNAMIYEDLYNHMSMMDYYGVFSSPALVPVKIKINKRNLFEAAIADPINGGKRVQIAQLTRFNVMDYHLALMYPIDIRVLEYGGITMTYSPIEKNPFHVLSTNIIDFVDTGDGYLEFTIDMLQLSYQSYSEPLETSKEFRAVFTLVDKFCYARLFYMDVNRNWVEFPTTHQAETLDITKMTGVLTVQDTQLTVHIPQMYTFPTGLSTMIRMDIYTTKGKINQSTEGLVIENFYGSIASVDDEYSNVYTDAFRDNVASKFIEINLPDGMVGGTDGLSFMELRERTLDNSLGIPEVPITPAQIESSLKDLGYDIIKHIDSVTERVYLATRTMPEPDDEDLITSANATMSRVAFTIENLITNNDVKDNGDVITLTPDVLYQVVNGVIYIMPSSRKEQILNMPIEQRIIEVNNNKYFFSPFHYMIDNETEYVDLRAYFMTAPKIKNLIFLGQNDTTRVLVGISEMGIEYTSTGYRVNIKTKSQDSFKTLSDNSVKVQLSFIPYNSNTRVYTIGDFVGKTDDGERYYTFNIKTDFKVGPDDQLYVTNFSNSMTDSVEAVMDLLCDLDIVFTSDAPKPATWKLSEIDAMLGGFQLPINSYAISAHRLRTRLGYSLDRLWRRVRGTVTTESYKHHEIDVPALYEIDVYKVYPETGATFKFDADGNLIREILHKRGDPILDANGQPTYQHRKGDVYLDPATREPVLLSPRNKLIVAYLFMLEAEYWFSTDLIAKNYLDKIYTNLVKWITVDLERLAKRSLDNTSVYFSPKMQEGMVKVMYLDGQQKTILAGQRFTVTLYVDASTANDKAMKMKLTKDTISTIGKCLNEVTVSIFDIEKALKEAYGENVISLSISGINGSDNLEVVTMVEDKDRLSLKKKLDVLADGTLVVREDVDIFFIKHDIADI